MNANVERRAMQEIQVREYADIISLKREKGKITPKRAVLLLGKLFEWWVD